MEYASEIWCQNIPIEQLERVQLKFFKNALRVRQSTPNLAVYGKQGSSHYTLDSTTSLLNTGCAFWVCPTSV